LIFINFRALLDREGAWGIFYSVSSEEPKSKALYYTIKKLCKRSSVKSFYINKNAFSDPMVFYEIELETINERFGF
ncbi:hypothetical protein, partial [Microcystis aeruginosa]|uniref:hypothetical protein n=1 Tax=Microcystis aeruginosa TaxID=1126 RepID=UPI001C0F2FC5